MKRVQMILQNLGKVEDEIFRMRQKRELEFRERDREKKRSEKREKEAANRFKVIALFSAFCSIWLALLDLMRVVDTFRP